jgi:hypothetical protein
MSWKCLAREDFLLLSLWTIFCTQLVVVGRMDPLKTAKNWILRLESGLIFHP